MKDLKEIADKRVSGSTSPELQQQPASARPTTAQAGLEWDSFDDRPREFLLEDPSSDGIWPAVEADESSFMNEMDVSREIRALHSSSPIEPKEKEKKTPKPLLPTIPEAAACFTDQSSPIITSSPRTKEPPDEATPKVAELSLKRVRILQEKENNPERKDVNTTPNDKSEEESAVEKPPPMRL